MNEIKVTLDRKSLARFRRLMAANPKIAAQSLTFTAERAVTAWRAGQSVFHRRNTWIDKGVRMRGATPGNLEAKVGSVDKFMGRHVVGFGEKKVAKGRLFVPNQPVEEQGTHRTIRAILRRADRTKRKPFKIGDTLFRREGKGRHGLVVLGFLTRGVKINPRLDAEHIVGDVVEREFPTIYQRLLMKWAEREG